MFKEINKDDFISILSSMSPEEMNELIKTKGKEAKPVSPIFHLKKKKEETDDGKIE